MSRFVKDIIYRLKRAQCSDCEKVLDIFTDPESNVIICMECYMGLENER